MVGGIPITRRDDLLIDLASWHIASVALHDDRTTLILNSAAGGALLAIVLTLAGGAARGANTSYAPISPTMADRTVTLTGAALTIEQIIEVARYGAKVALSPESRERENDNYGLLLEAAAEGIPVYWFNRGAGQQRETVIFSGDPLEPANRAQLEQSQLARFRSGAVAGTGPEVADEESVRAMMVVRANGMIYNAPSPQLAQMLLDLLNQRITPVVQSRGTLGEGDLAQLSNVGATMVGSGEAYYQGRRVSAMTALRLAGLRPIEPFAADDNALTSSNAYATGQAAILVDAAEHALDWADLAYAIDLDGMNSSITPLSMAVQRDRPEAWLNWHAHRMLDLLQGAYLFAADEHRIIQDPESLRASSIRQASAWEAWARLRDAVVLQANSSDHNPAVSVGLGPGDSWELATPQLMRYYVKGGPRSHGQHGYIVSNANWDPYPLANEIEAFDIAVANMDIAVMLRIERFRNPFFTGATAQAVLPGAAIRDWGYSPVDLQQEIQSLMGPIAPFGSAIIADVEDLQAQTRIKVQKARQIIATTIDLLGFDLIEGSLWLDVRKAQDPARAFGIAPTAVWRAFRERVPLASEADGGTSPSPTANAAQFLRTTQAERFLPEGLESAPRTSSAAGARSP
jgi:histidine ammonia-lyase